MTLPQFPAATTAPFAAFAFDYGTQKIGVAYGQSVTGTAQAIAVLPARDGIPDWDAVASLIKEWQPQIFVVGLPYNMDGSGSKLLPRAIKFGNRLNGRFNLPCFGIDERLSSREAREQLWEQSLANHFSGVKRGVKNRAAMHDVIDDIAARIILQNWFAEWRNQSQAKQSNL